MIPTPPPQPVAVASGRVSGERVFGMTVVLFLFTSTVAVLLGGVTSVVIFLIASSDDSASGWDGLESLGWALFGGLVTTVVAYVIAACLIVRGLLPVGQRAIPVVAVLIGPPVVLFVLGLLANLAE